MNSICILVRKTQYQATFEPVRSVRHLTLGWATVTAEDCRLRFPAIVDNKNDRVLTVHDWQAPWTFRDLSDPRDYADMVRTGSGTFRTSAGNASDAYQYFL